MARLTWRRRQCTRPPATDFESKFVPCVGFQDMVDPRHFCLALLPQALRDVRPRCWCAHRPVANNAVRICSVLQDLAWPSCLATSNMLGRRPKQLVDSVHSRPACKNSEGSTDSHISAISTLDESSDLGGDSGMTGSFGNRGQESTPLQQQVIQQPAASQQNQEMN